MKMDKNITKFLFKLFVILWLLIIFSLSSQPGTKSNELSKKVTKQIIETTEKVVMLNDSNKPKTNLVNKLNDVVREYAHAAVYLVLGVLVMNAFIMSGVRGYKAFVFSFIFCILYAVTDEIHQLVVPGRGTEVADILIDSIGALIGIGLYKFIFKIYSTLKPKPSPKRL
jgi:VanZ family protein